MNPQWSLLDPELHSHRFVRERSIFLFTVILAIGSTAIATSSCGTTSDVAEALKLQAYAEQMLIAVYVTGSKSCEIIQGHILFHVWSFHTDRYLDDNRCVRMAMCSRMALELGLHRERLPSLVPEVVERMMVNNLRTRAFLLIVENRRADQSFAKPFH
jgi:hypothetical protein